MRRYIKREVLELLKTIKTASSKVGKLLKSGNRELLQNYLSECQEAAIQAGNTIEEAGTEGTDAIKALEEFCELLYQVLVQERDFSKELVGKIKQASNVIDALPERKEIVFFPYKASMWDSLESVYLAAKADPDCDVYCVPIPYFDLNQDHSFGQMHYEGNDYPKNIEITDWQTYRFEDRRPDVMYIHNPYDDWNFVTSVHPRFYSANLKQYTETLVYIPYYSTSGGMSEGQRLCSAYLNADYIVIQSPKFRSYFDESIPDEKFLPFGSPKFDRIIHKCQKPSALSEEWQEKMIGKKVYFYNTSISGMLANTEDFLRKMEYVFNCFKGRKDACILWRPHPLLESTFASMRPQYLPFYKALKEDFVKENLGILDATPDMADAIALSDAYIGDAGTSVTSLFGITGKPLFILNNRLHSEPTEDSWRGEISVGFNFWEQDRFAITQGNKLYVSEAYAYDYKHYCDLSEYAYGSYYSIVFEIGGKLYVCPRNAQNILVIGEKGIERTIELKKRVGKDGAFCRAWKQGKYLFLIPLKYPAVVRYNTQNGEIRYFDKNIDTFIKEDKGETKIGGGWVSGKFMYIASPTDNQVYKLDMESGETEVIELPIKSRCGCLSMIGYQDEVWLFPYEGKVIVRWNPNTGDVREYTDFPADFNCYNPMREYSCEERPFGTPAFYNGYLYLTPCWGNQYLKLNIATGEVTKWSLPFEEGEGKEYYFATAKSSFIWRQLDEKGPEYMVYSYPARKLYRINLETDAYEEIAIKFDVEELKNYEPGFCEYSEWLRYVCLENSFNSLKGFLDGNIVGNQFDRDNQLNAYQEIAANYDGSCGQKVHDFISKRK